MIASLRACACGFVLLLNMATATFAPDQTIILEFGGTGSMFMLDRPFETVLIGDPNVIGVHIQTDRSVMLEPLNLGASDLVFLDERKIAISNIRVFVCNGIRTPSRQGSDCD
jgi:Flp pilus assembly secretin CpaC